MKRILFIALTTSFLCLPIFAVPVLPGKPAQTFPYQNYPSDNFSRWHDRNSRALPQSILALMVEFTDVQFDLVPDFPDSLAHNKVFYERLLYHNACYWADASHGRYVLTEDNYTVWNEVLSLPNTMGYYGDDNLQIERVCQMVVDAIDLVDEVIDFNDYDAIIIIHAGAGQETDPSMTDQIYSTFLSRRSLQAGLDPENNDFPGIPTNDGIYLREFAIIPETSNQPYVQPGDTLYGLLGVIAHNFGHQLGLPTLFDNNSTNGASYGIGGFGVMGTGVWNANGYVPPLPCAWSRYYMGWETNNIVEIDATSTDLQLTFPQANDSTTPKLYKLRITDEEYFLIENRQQNPDGSIYINALGDTVVSFTFATIPNQPVYPAGNINAGQPKFDYMQNSYLGCEWDFFLPGYGFSSNPADNGSGILIWHIDENVIAENFDPDFEKNMVNGDASHKGVDLEEADGIQHLDSILHGYLSFYGSRNDAYRLGNNVYFGKNSYLGMFSTPTAESYYGGIPLEVYDISSADSVMTFSVRYNWALNADFLGVNRLPLLIEDFDDDGQNEIMQILPNGEVYLWKDDEICPGFPIDTNSSVIIPYPCTYDEIANSVLMPGRVELSNSAVLFQINLAIQDSINQIYFEIDREWVGPVIAHSVSSNPNRFIFGLNRISSAGSKVVFMDEYYTLLQAIEFDFTIASNLMLAGNSLHFIDENWESWIIDLENYWFSQTALAFAGTGFTGILSAQMADLDNDDLAEYVVVSSDSLLHVFRQNGSYLNGYPRSIPLKALSLPSFADVDGNGYLDILIGGENTFAVFDKNGTAFSPSKTLENPDILRWGSGVIAFDANADGKPDIVGNMSRNRFSLWENIRNNDFRLNRHYPVTSGERSLNYPVLAEYAGEPLAAYLNCNNGVIYRVELPSGTDPFNAQTMVEYCSLQRTACWQGIQYPPPETDNKIFVKEETYFYPNPLGSTFSRAIDYGRDVPDQTIILRILTTKDTNVQIKVFDIAANKIYEKNSFCENGMINKVYFEAKNLASGVYFAILKANGKVLNLKFAVEK